MKHDDRTITPTLDPQEAVKLGRWSYFISPTKFTEYTGIEVPVNP